MSAQKMATPAGEAPGPWILGTIGVGKTADPKTPKTTALKGIAIKVGEKGEAAVAYDLDLCRFVGAWTGKFTTPMNLMSRGEYPTAMGEVAFTSGEVEGFLPLYPAGEGTPAWKDPRTEPFGPLPAGHPRFQGFQRQGKDLLLRWELGAARILETPGFRDGFFTRTLTVTSPPEKTVTLLACALPEGELVSQGVLPSDLRIPGTIDGPIDGPIQDAVEYHVFKKDDRVTAVALICRNRVKSHAIANGQLWISFVPHQSTRSDIEIRYWSGALGEETKFLAGLRDNRRPTVLTLADPADALRWPEPVVTSGELSTKQDEAYVVDTIKLPDPNPWGAPMFVGGFDFFADGRAAVCTFHGDVFLVSGIDEKLEKVTWRRFASGLYHALGLKIVNNEVYVTCRDGIWRLKDLNNDGEADFYELFNGDVKVTKSFHEFVFDLQTDPAGNFYLAKAGPVKNGGRGFDEIMAHHGSLLRVSPDGAKLDVVATGFRAPNGIGCGPDGQLTTGDNEGTWTPVCKINWIKPGGFYGVVPLAHRDPLPTDYDRPLCWLPKRVDNSGGSQVWVTSDQWGPWKNQLLHLSYGTCSVLGVLREEVSGVDVPSALSPRPATVQQGGVVRFPVNFQSGIMRARFHPVDGQLYVAGLRGWQTTGVKNGAFQRVRYTGAPVRMPIGLHATKRGVRLDFACALDPASANDPQNWNIEVWNYLWSGAYGSPELSTMDSTDAPGEKGKDGEAQFSKAQMDRKKHDTLTVKSVTLSADGKSVFLEIPEVKPVMQMAIKFGIKTADGAELRSEVVNTIHALGE